MPYTITEGSPAHARGLNIIGLKRAGVEGAELQALKKAARVLKNTTMLAEILASLQVSDSVKVQQIAAFIRKSQRGFTHYR